MREQSDRRTYADKMTPRDAIAAGGGDGLVAWTVNEKGRLRRGTVTWREYLPRDYYLWDFVADDGTMLTSGTCGKPVDLDWLRERLIAFATAAEAKAFWLQEWREIVAEYRQLIDTLSAEEAEE